MGAIGGIGMLRATGLPVLAGTGCLTASPLAIRESAAVHGLPMLDLAALSSPDVAERLGLEHSTIAVAA
jgi:hypothetical protein